MSYSGLCFGVKRASPYLCPISWSNSRILFSASCSYRLRVLLRLLMFSSAWVSKLMTSDSEVDAMEFIFFKSRDWLSFYLDSCFAKFR